MTDYIKREDAVRRVAVLIAAEAESDGCEDQPMDNYIEYALEDLADIPSADVAPVRHGRWEDEFKEDAEAFVKHRYVCTVCGNWQTYGKTAYCPNCGAKMDEGGSNGTDNK